MPNQRDETLFFRLVRDANGKPVPVQVGRRNGLPAALLPPGCGGPHSEQPESEFFEQGKYYVNLNPVERRTWSKILRGWPLNRIAADEGVTHQAIIERIRGNSKGQGGMVAKNFYVVIWWLARQNQREHKPK